MISRQEIGDRQGCRDGTLTYRRGDVVIVNGGSLKEGSDRHRLKVEVDGFGGGIRDDCRQEEFLIQDNRRQRVGESSGNRSTVGEETVSAWADGPLSVGIGVVLKDQATS